MFLVGAAMAYFISGDSVTGWGVLGALAIGWALLALYALGIRHGKRTNDL